MDDLCGRINLLRELLYGVPGGSDGLQRSPAVRIRGVGGICGLLCVLGDLAGSGRHLVDRGRHHIDLGLLALHARTTGTGGISQRADIFPEFGATLLDIPNNRLDILDKLVKAPGQLTEFIFCTVVQTLGQVGITTANVRHGLVQAANRRHQDLDAQMQNHQRNDQADHGHDQSSHSGALDRCVDLVRVYKRPQIPLHAARFTDRMEAGLPVAVIITVFVSVPAKIRLAANELTDVLADKALPWVEQYGATLIDQSSVTGVRKGDCAQGFCYRAQADISTGHALVFTALHGRKCGDDHVVGAGILIRLGERGASKAHGLLVPGALAGIVIRWQRGIRLRRFHQHVAVGTPDIDIPEAAAGGNGLKNDPRLFVVLGILQGFGGGFSHHQPGIEPLCDARRALLHGVVDQRVHIGFGGAL